jgi:16S rRNA (adenine1518-N6/adenine1519-N6)-dimethyltransferase
MKRNFAKKSFGQNFLVDQSYIQKIVAAVSPQPGETVIEIGPGQGALTEKLVDSGANVIAIELDRDLIAPLSVQFFSANNFTLLEADALEVDYIKLVGPNAKLIANLPYNISTAILQKLIEQRSAFSEMILMFQREVVDRITAKVGNKDRGYLTVLVEAYLHSEKLFDVSPNAFRPVPKVWSSLVRLHSNSSKFDETFDELFREIVSIAFMQKRKTIQNNFKNAKPAIQAKFETLGGIENVFRNLEIDPKRRAETLSAGEWHNLVKAVSIV